MARVLIIGASKGIGLETVQRALAAGHTVRAFARSPVRLVGADTSRLEVVKGNALKSEDVEAALDRVDVVIQTLGIGLGDMLGPVQLFSKSTRVLLPAMEARRVRRLIAVTGFGAGDSKSSISFLHYIPFRLVFGRAYDDKDIQEKLIKASSLDWTLVRPGILTNGHRLGTYQVLTEPKDWHNGTISRADVADFLVQQITDRTHVRKTPVLVY